MATAAPWDGREIEGAVEEVAHTLQCRRDGIRESVQDTIRPRVRISPLPTDVPNPMDVRIRPGHERRESLGRGLSAHANRGVVVQEAVNERCDVRIHQATVE